MDDRIDTLVGTYCEDGGICPETLERCGEQYRAQGHLTRRQLYALAYEVSARNAHLVFENTNRECETVTTNVASLGDDLSRVTLLTGLSGFETTTASCVLTGLDPGRYAIADASVWEGLVSLGRVHESRDRIGPREYCRLLEHARRIAADVDRPVADVGFALSAYGLESS
ncbi:hypothetical protein [Natrononativus amylolyticus]|uniref:hypothetical protein n=1 Tax=Natrononativus amylolyticus TaxID=2963434 RepID=UPI0020CC9240|nr:hypothetical protein [Natrononativus amylolyticus]